MARDNALSKDNILSGFEAFGRWPLRLEGILDRSTTSTTTTVTISTPRKVANMQSILLRLTITSNPQAIMDDGLIHLEKKVVYTQVIDPVWKGLKYLRNDKKIKPRQQNSLIAPEFLIDPILRVKRLELLLYNSSK